VAIVPPHLTVLSMRMAVALYVTGISTPEVNPEFPPLLGTLTRRYVVTGPRAEKGKGLGHLPFAGQATLQS
jgi:hypothetical protein